MAKEDAAHGSHWVDPDTATRMQGAVICIRWNNEGTAIATGGEDGVIKIWSCPILTLRTTTSQKCVLISRILGS